MRCLRLLSPLLCLALASGNVPALAADGTPASDGAPNAAVPPPAAPPAAPAETPGASALAVDIEPNAGGLDADRLRDAIAAEASVRVTSAVTSDMPRLVIRGAGPRAMRLELVQPGGARTERIIELPDENETKSLATAALVAASLLEDDAAELLARLRAEKTKADEDAARAAELAKMKAEEPPPPPPRRRKKYPPLPPCVARPRGRIRVVGADVAPYVGTSTFEPEGTVRRFSFELLGGHAAGVAGFEFSPIVSAGSGFVCGAQLSGVAGWVNGPLRGLGFGGLFQGNTDLVQGLTLAGFLDIAGPVEGAEIAGFGGWVDRFSGVQANGFASITTRTATGLQVAGTLVMADEVRGVQIGAIPIAGEVHGVQIGVIDVARKSDASIGVVQIVTEGRTTLHAFAGTDGVTTVALEHGSRYVHNLYGAALSLAGKEGLGYGPMLGIGAHPYEDARVFFDVDLLGTVMFSAEKGGDPQALWQGRIIGGVKLGRQLALYAGPTYDVQFVPSGQQPRTYTGPFSARTANTGGGTLHLSPGLALGVRGL